MPKKLRVLSLYVPPTIVKMADLLAGENGMYHSRCELFRVAIRDFILQKMEEWKELLKTTHTPLPKGLLSKEIYIQKIYAEEP